MKDQEKNKESITASKTIYFTRSRVNLVTGYPDVKVHPRKKRVETNISIGHIK